MLHNDCTINETVHAHEDVQSNPNESRPPRVADISVEPLQSIRIALILCILPLPLTGNESNEPDQYKTNRLKRLNANTRIRSDAIRDFGWPTFIRIRLYASLSGAALRGRRAASGRASVRSGNVRHGAVHRLGISTGP